MSTHHLWDYLRSGLTPESSPQPTLQHRQVFYRTAEPQHRAESHCEDKRQHQGRLASQQSQRNWKQRDSNVRYKSDAEQSLVAVEPISGVPPHLSYYFNHICVADALVTNVFQPVTQRCGTQQFRASSALARSSLSKHLFSRMLLRICILSLSVMPPK